MNATNIRRRAHQRVADVRTFILANIAKGLWKPGDKLPTERELGARFRLARNTLRRGLTELVEERRITRQVGRGTFVAPTEPNGASQLTIEADLAARILRASPAEVMDLRLMIEPQAIERATARATGDDLDAMQECLKRGHVARSTMEFEHWDAVLHKRIVAAACNTLLATLYDAVNLVRHQAEWGRLKERTLTPERRRIYETQHRRIIETLCDRDPQEAVAALRNHLMTVRRNLLGE
jgi:GntR family transcriptional regulator, transcriptional repressor for pyruvate dehydrogenase complex